MKYKHLFLNLSALLMLSIAIGVTFFFYRPTTAADTHAAAIPDAFMEDVVAVIFDKQGRPSLKIVTPKMIHYAEHDTTNLTTPQLTLYRKSLQPWLITATYAKATQGIDHVNFWDNVIIHHPADQNNPATLIKTPTLTVHPTVQTAETKDPIMLIQPNLTIQATGMHADINTGEIKLLSEARGEYVPSS